MPRNQIPLTCWVCAVLCTGTTLESVLDEKWIKDLIQPIGREINRNGTSLVGYNWQEDTIVWTTTKSKNSDAFISFIKELLVKPYPTGQKILVTDMLLTIRSASVLAALSLFEHRVMVF